MVRALTMPAAAAAEAAACMILGQEIHPRMMRGVGGGPRLTSPRLCWRLFAAQIHQRVQRVQTVSPLHGLRHALSHANAGQRHD